MAANNISTLPTKEERQIAKLELAQTKRQLVGTPGYRDLRYYDLALLPTRYSGNDVVYQTHPEGLVAGRPWKTTPNTTLGLWRSVYNGNFNGDQTWFDTQTPASSGPVTDFTITDIVGDNTSMQWVGYFKAPHTANYIFWLYSDDVSILWIGDHAVTTYNEENWDVYTNAGQGLTSSDPIALTAGQYYPIRVQYANGIGSAYLNVSWEDDYVGPITTYEFVDPLGNNRDAQVTGIVDIQVHSSSFNATPVTNGTITINGSVEVDATSRGHTVLFMAPNGAVLGSNNYDTYDTNSGALASLNNDLIMNPSGSIIAMCTYDASGLDAQLRNTLNTYYGGTLTNTWLASRYSHIFIGQRV